MIKKAVILVAFCLSLYSTTSAQLVIGKYAGEFMALGAGGRANAMGGAFTAVANDVTAGYFNPAGLANMNYPQIALMHEERFGNLINYNYAAVALPYGNDMTFGLSIIRLGIDDIPDTREALVQGATKEVFYNIDDPNARIDPEKVLYFNDADWAFYLSFAKRHSDKFSYGASVKIIRRDIAEFGATGIGFDIGALYSPVNNLFLGANVQDITTTLVAWSTGRNELITPTAKIGAAYGVDFGFGTLMPAVDLDVRFENRKFASQFNVGPVSFDPHAGLEFIYKGLFAIRAGYNDVKNVTVGAGIKLPKLNIDYSFAKFAGSKDDDLGDSHRISLILTLEEPKFLRTE